jgi:DNA-binding NarL/FixJ family response regulator
LATILLVEDQAVVRSGIRALLEEAGDHTVVGEASTAREAVDLHRRLDPDLTVMDIGLGQESGIAACREIRQASPGARVLMLSVYRERAYVEAALEAGASGYVLKWASPEVLKDAIRTVLRGERFIDPLLVDTLLREPPKPRLSPREREILARIAAGLSTKEVAAALGLSVKTVETHRQHIMEKLDLHDVASLVRYAVREGLIEP